MENAACDGTLYFFWIAGLSARSVVRRRRGKIGSPINDTIENDFLKYLKEESILAEIELYGHSTIISETDAAKAIIGFIIVETCGGWENVLTSQSGQRRWTFLKMNKTIYIYI